MRFDPKSQEQIDKENLCEEGDYPFTVLEASEETSKKNQPMFKLKVNVHGDNDRDWHIYDYVSPAFMAHRLLHLCECTGLFPSYSRGELTASEILGKQGHCSVEIKEQKGYAAKNVISDYIVPDRKKAMAANSVRASAPTTSTKPPSDDDVPF